MSVIEANILDELEGFDTPTICNALEMIDPVRRFFGFTRHLMHSFNPDVGPVVGYAKTATMRSLDKSEKSSATLKEERLEYYRYVSEGDRPKIAVMQDLDGKEAGIGPFWGEFNTRIHQSLGCKAVVTDGSLRDIDLLPKDLLIVSAGPRPSHAHIHVTGFGQQVSVFGMYVSSHNLVHADLHGAVTFPDHLAEDVIKSAREFVASEAPILTECRKRNLSFEEVAKLYMSR